MIKVISSLITKLEQRLSHLRIFLERRKQDIPRGYVAWDEPYERRKNWIPKNQKKIDPITGEEE